MKKKSAKSKYQFPTLPDHLVLDQILPRLPVKSLIRFKSVSKHWLGTISSDKFQKTHLKFSFSCPQALIFKGVYMDGKSYLLSFNESNNVKEFVELKHKYPVISPPYRNSRGGVGASYAVGSCNGIVCLYGISFCFYLWNPATKQCHNVHSPAVDYHINYKFTGFGYISSIDDYRIGCLLTVKQGLCHIYIFSLRSGKWKQMDTVNYSFAMPRTHVSVLVDDTIYWPPDVQKLEGKENYVVGLNLVSGRLEKFPLKNLLIGYKQVNVFRMEGCLSLCCVKYVNRKYSSRVSDIWMLKQHDDWNSWEKIFSFNIGGVDLVCIFETGKCLVSREDRLKLLDPSEVADEAPEDNAFCQGSDSSEGGTYFEDIYECIEDTWDYAESLISPFGTAVSVENEDD